MFITFEGIEGCGKTTQISLLGNFLDTKGLPYIITREPGGTEIGEEIRKILLSSQNKDMSLTTELFLYLASRAQHIKEVIKPALVNKKIVLCDRFSYATIAYQVYARGFDLKLVKKLNQLATSGLTSDITILFDCPVDIGITRAIGRIRSEANQAREDRFEREDRSFHEKVREGYLKVARRNESIIVIDGTKDIEIIHEEICKTVFPKIMKREMDVV
ncbi:MAG: dTMP kinase [Thermodesulfobacteriota bacterium]